MIELLDTSLVLIETRQRELGLMAVQDCLKQVKFGDVLIFSDKPEFFTSRLGSEYNIRAIEVPDWPEKIGWSRFLWSGVAPYLRTSFMLSVQWDSWAVDYEAWDDEFYCYDYIGAPWTWYHDGRRIGNGGFSLRSTRLMRYLRAHRDVFPCTTDLDDDLLCRRYRPQLEEVGFVWAPEPLATRFAFECAKPDHETFGFHALYNFGMVLEHDRLLERCRVAMKSPYIYPDSWMWVELCKRNPTLEAELTA
jgi:Protein of unknown function (DUF5672)